MMDGDFVKELLDDLEKIKTKIIDSNKLEFASVFKLLNSVQNNIVNRYQETIEMRSKEKN